MGWVDPGAVPPGFRGPISGGLGSRERRRDDPRLLGLVRRGIPFRRARALRAPDVAYGHFGADELAELRQHELLRPHVARLFLHPHDLAQGGVPANQRRQFLAWERIE